MQKRILIVDPDSTSHQFCARILRDDYEVAIAESGEECLERAEELQPDLVFLEIDFQGTDGYDVCRRLKKMNLRDHLMVVMLSSRSESIDRLVAYRAGASDYLTKPIDPNDILAKIRIYFRLQSTLDLLTEARNQLNEQAKSLEQEVDSRGNQIAATQDIAIISLARLADSRDPETGEHLMRIRAYSQLLAEQLLQEGTYPEEIDAHFVKDLYRASPLHDIGKVGISDKVLLKPGSLTTEEYSRMKEHAVIGGSMLDHVVQSMPCGRFLKMAAEVARYHHERYDGTGYAEGLLGNEIPLSARIVSLADVYDAVTSKRVYKEAIPPDEAKKIIESESGKHFDPVIVRAFQQQFGAFIVAQEDLNGKDVWKAEECLA